MSVWDKLRAAVLVAALAGFASGCVVVVGDRGQDEEWGVHWAGSDEVDRSTPSDGLAREVSSRMAADPALAGQDITVSAREGVVTLHGRVDSVEALEDVMTLAAQTPGVTRVVSRLTVVRETS
jgi:hypothetical protein